MFFFFSTSFIFPRLSFTSLPEWQLLSFPFSCNALYSFHFSHDFFADVSLECITRFCIFPSVKCFGISYFLSICSYFLLAKFPFLFVLLYFSTFLTGFRQTFLFPAPEAFRIFVLLTYSRGRLDDGINTHFNLLNYPSNHFHTSGKNITQLFLNFSLVNEGRIRGRRAGEKRSI